MVCWVFFNRGKDLTLITKSVLPPSICEELYKYKGRTFACD